MPNRSQQKEPGAKPGSFTSNRFLSQIHRHRQIQHISHDPRSRVISHHIAAIVPILVSHRRRRRTSPIRLRHRLNHVLSRNTSALYKHRTLAVTPRIRITPVVGVKLIPVIALKVIVVPVLLSLPRRHAAMSRIPMVIITTMLLGLPGRHPAMSRRWIVRIMPRRALRNTQAGGC